ncbi:hypothetical protein [Nostoc sp.]|uniref:hypothetical protein n=1 Tax=Nostoc sp. TaxID=1180 RepID=UPI002FFA834C
MFITKTLGVGVGAAFRREASRTRVRLPLGEEKALRYAIGDAIFLEETSSGFLFKLVISNGTRRITKNGAT